MERIDVSEDGRIAAWVDAIELGKEVLFTRDGSVVAEVKPPADPPKPRPVFDPVKLAALHATLGPMAGGDVTRLVREMRDARRSLIVYLDASIVAGVALLEPGWERIAHVLGQQERIVWSDFGHGEVVSSIATRMRAQNLGAEGAVRTIAALGARRVSGNAI